MKPPLTPGQKAVLSKGPAEIAREWKMARWTMKHGKDDLQNPYSKQNFSVAVADEYQSLLSHTMEEIVSRVEEMAKGQPIGRLQEIRRMLKPLKKLPSRTIFTKSNIHKDWACHEGGRSELQFNLGFEKQGAERVLRYGVAFSLETSKALQDPVEMFRPKVRLFNDYVSTNADDFSHLRMWYYRLGKRSLNQAVVRIQDELLEKGNFIFIGETQPIGFIRLRDVIEVWNELLSLYRYVESNGGTRPLPLEQAPFTFKPGCTSKPYKTRASLNKTLLDVDLRHNLLQQKLYEQLVARYGKNNVGTEQSSGVGKRVDVIVRRHQHFLFYEIKTALTPRACIREAVGQLLEYSYWPGAKCAHRLIVVGETPLDKDGEMYLNALAHTCKIPIEYQAVTI